MKDHQSGSNSDSYCLTPSHSPAPAPAYDGDEDLEMQQIELEERLTLCNKKALHAARSSRPENTKKAYIPRQKEWRVRSS
jgi:hypothetical protein